MNSKNRTRVRQLVDTRSISFKVWSHMTIFAIILLITLWGLEVLFLTNYYESMKSLDISRTSRELIQNYNKNKDITMLTEAANQASRANDLMIFIRDDTGRNVLSTESTSMFQSPALQKNYEVGIALLLNKLRTTSLRSTTTTMTSDQNRNKILGYAGYLTEEDINSPHRPWVLVIFTPLYPMRSTIAILRSQLIYVTFIALALALLIGLVLAIRITVPIKRITLDSMRMGTGRYDVEFDGGNLTEIQELAGALTRAEHAFQQMDSYQKDLIANVSHDLRTPLTMIKSYAEMIRDLSGDIPEKREAHVNVIIEETDRLNSLVADLLNMSKLQSGHIELDLSEFDLREAAESVLAPYMVLNDSEGYQIQLKCRKGTYPVFADENRIKQVMSNLISNAVKYCGEDKTVLVELVRVGRFIQFAVSDHGQGISSEELPYVWDRYYQTSTHHARTAEGTGLGLSIVKEILQLHNARFNVESKLGQGSTFWFELPLYKAKGKKSNKKQ